MRCSNCGNENKEGGKFCSKCGAKLAQVPAPAPVEVNATAPIKLADDQNLKDLSTRPLARASIVFKESGKEIQVPYKADVVLGREDKKSGNIPDIDVTEVDVDKVVSRKHSSILFFDGLYKIKDLGSLNGTFLNGVRLNKDVEYELNSGDEIKLGKIVCTFKSIG